MFTMFKERTEKSQSDVTQQFHDYLDADWKRWMQEYPQVATQLGFSVSNRGWTNYSLEGIAKRKQHLNESLAELKQISRAALSKEEQLNYDIYFELLKNAIEGLQYGNDPWPFRGASPHNLWMPLDQMSGIYQEIYLRLNAMPHQTVVDYENILARLEALPLLLSQIIVLLQEGLKGGYTPPKLMLRDIPKQITDLVPENPFTSALLNAFTDFPTGFSEATKTRLKHAAESVYINSVKPAYLQFRDYVAGTYIPACRESIAAIDLPNGVAAYDYLMRWHTTTQLNAQNIHEIGLSEVKRIRLEMEKIITTSGFKGDFKEFTEFLRTDPQFYHKNADDLVNAYRVIAKKIEPELLNLFGKLPRLPYGIRQIPDFFAPSQTTAYYQSGSVQGNRPGWFYVNTYNLSARPKWEMEALTAHEAVPGHHLERSLAREKENMPEFRKNLHFSAYVEGWGLYAENLGAELGLYKDCYAKFGQLTNEMWRAVRLVVDTGIHALGWTREQAIQFFMDNTGKSIQDITVEVDRYIVMPAQALAYKIGQLKILELRKTMETHEGENFDVRKFHDAVLANGALPLLVLEKQLMIKDPDKPCLNLHA